MGILGPLDRPEGTPLARREEAGGRGLCLSVQHLLSPSLGHTTAPWNSAEDGEADLPMALHLPGILLRDGQRSPFAVHLSL